MITQLHACTDSARDGRHCQAERLARWELSVLAADVRGGPVGTKHQPIVRLYHVDQAFQATFDIEGHLTDLNRFVPHGRLFREHGLNAGRGAGQADPGPWVEAPGGLLRAVEDVPGPVGELDHPYQ